MGIDFIKNKVKVFKEENKDATDEMSKMSSELFTKEKNLEILKRKVSVLKSFLAGPLLEVDGASKEGDAADAVPEEELKGEPEAEAEPQLMESAQSRHAPLSALPD